MEEVELIRLAQQHVTFNGVTVPTAAAQNAKEELLRRYQNKINKTAHKSQLEYDDIRSDLTVAFLEMIERHEGQNPLGHEINLTFAAVVRNAQAKTAAFTIPSQQRAKFYHILYKLADGNWHKALRLVDEDPRITRETFVAIAQALHAVETIEDATGDLERQVAREMWGSRAPVSNMELTDFVAWLKVNLRPRELLLIDLVYGFESDEAVELRLRDGFSYDEPVSLRVAAGMMRIGKSTAARIHDAALETMRSKVHNA